MRHTNRFQVAFADACYWSPRRLLQVHRAYVCTTWSTRSCHTGTCTRYARRDNATFVPINTTTDVPCWRCQWDALNNLSSFEALRFNDGPAHTYFTLPYLQWYAAHAPHTPATHHHPAPTHPGAASA